MRKAILLTSLIIVILCSTKVYALDWANIFVVWKGKVYVVNEDIILLESEIGKKIGQVKRQANDMTGKYYGDASNIYIKGTPYYNIHHVPTSEAIAVKVDSKFLKADYSRQAPFHLMNIISNIYFILCVVLLTLVLVLLRKMKEEKKEK